MKCVQTYAVALILLVVVAAPMANADHSPTHSRWSIEAGDADGETEVLVVKDNGRLNIPLFIVNENFISITIEFEYTAPFEATIIAPESLTIQGSSSQEIMVMLSEIDPFEHTAGSTGEFEVVGTVTSRQGLPVSVPGDSDSSTIDIEVPSIHYLEVDLKGPSNTIQAGQTSTLEVSLSNSGNVAEQASRVTVSSNCPLLTFTEKSPKITDQTMATGATLVSEISFEVAADQITTACNVVVEVLFTWSDDSQTYSDSVRVNVAEIAEEEEEEGLTVSRNLPAPGALSGILVALLAAIVRRSE